jgi:hypothetical protein
MIRVVSYSILLGLRSRGSRLPLASSDPPIIYHVPSNRHQEHHQTLPIDASARFVFVNRSAFD